MTEKRKRAAAHVRITAGAERDLAGIYERRLAQRGAGGADGADALLDELVAAIEGIADFKYRGPMAERSIWPTAWTDFDETRLDLLRDRLMAFFRRKGHSTSDSEDLVQDVFLRLSKPAGQDAAREDSYVFTVARNLLRDRQRRQRVRVRNGSPVEQEIFEIVHGASDAIDPERVLLGRDEAERLLEGLAELPDRTREIFLLYRLEGMAQREIATRFGLSISAVEKNVAKAMLHLLRKVDRKR